jgi:hypothetical protein
MLYPIIVSAYLAFIVVVVFACKRIGFGWWVWACVAVMMLLAPFWDVFLAKGIMLNFAQNNEPLQKIIRTVDNPESVIWVDNVWPGFDEYGRHWMVENYLDGVHLSTLAMNDGKGSVHVYRATADDYTQSSKLWPEVTKAKNAYENIYRQAGHRVTKEAALFQLDYFKKRRNFDVMRKKEAANVVAREEVYSLIHGKSSLVDLPRFKYKVQLDRVRLVEWQEGFVWCDNLKIYDLQNEELIASNKRCLSYSPKISIIMDGASPFEGGLKIGDTRTYEFDNEILFKYVAIQGTQWTKDLLEKSKYRRNVLDLKN